MSEGLPNYVLLFGLACILAGGVAFCAEKSKGCSPCGGDPTEPEGLKTVTVGNVEMNGETCVVEEVQQLSGVCVEPESNKARGCRESVRCRQPLVRRVTCPSGKNGQSSVVDDGTKFHRETLK